MSTYDEFKEKYPKLIAEAEEDLKMEEEECLDDVYCPECGSCGEEGCCPPDMCKTVQGFYCDDNLRSYRAMEREWDVMNDALKKIAQGQLQASATEFASDILEVIDRLVAEEVAEREEE